MIKNVLESNGRNEWGNPANVGPLCENGGTTSPSVEDLHNFFGLVSVIVQYPYKKEDIYAWSSAGERVELEVE